MRGTRSARKRALDDGPGGESLEATSDREEKRQKSSHTAFRAGLAQFQYSDDTTTNTSPSPDKANLPVKKPKPSPSPSPSKSRRQQKQTGYAPPSTYAHLPLLTDVIVPGLIAVFIGTNPGIATATQGHAYAHPSNLFWKLLYSSGCTAVRHPPSDDVNLPRLYALGNTNIVARPTRDAGQLSKTETAAGTPILEAKIAKFQPEAVCVVGKGIWEAIVRWRKGRNPTREEFHYGWQAETENMGRSKDWPGAKVFVATSTSGLSAGLRPPEKEAIWKPFGEWVAKRRAERAEESIENPVYHRESRVIEDVSS
ncbi:hypothetical protein ANO11243_088150 [Dothideomycetidae sp. 11243]|nr:hypothetical protein ANO11243_088150 [fungal sp. No.11243]